MEIIPLITIVAFLIGGRQASHESLELSANYRHLQDSVFQVRGRNDKSIAVVDSLHSIKLRRMGYKDYKPEDVDALIAYDRKLICKKLELARKRKNKNNLSFQ